MTRGSAKSSGFNSSRARHGSEEHTLPELGGLGHRHGADAGQLGDDRAEGALAASATSWPAAANSAAAVSPMSWADDVGLSGRLLSGYKYWEHRKMFSNPFWTGI